MRDYDEVGRFKNYPEEVNEAYRTYASVYLDWMDDNLRHFTIRGFDTQPVDGISVINEPQKAVNLYLEAAWKIMQELVEKNFVTKDEVKEYYPLLAKFVDAKLKNYVSEDGTYIIPVSWEVYSTIRVKANSLAEAVELAKKHIDDIPISDENEYIDGSYKIQIESDEDALNAQKHQEMSGMLFDWEE